MPRDPYERADAIYRTLDRSETVRFGVNQSALNTQAAKAHDFGGSAHVETAALLAYESLTRHVTAILEVLAAFHAENGGALTADINQEHSTFWARARLKNAVTAKKATFKCTRQPESEKHYTELVDGKHASNARQLLDSTLTTFFSEANPDKPAGWVERGLRAARKLGIDLAASALKTAADP
ncbi:MAG: hypothetical protein ABI585_11785 [Betaproteobacteria bacterium]